MAFINFIKVLGDVLESACSPDLIFFIAFFYSSKNTNTIQYKAQRTVTQGQQE